MTVEKVADYPSGGTRTYKHNITAYSASDIASFSFVIENDNDTPITTWEKVNDYLYEKGCIRDSNNPRNNAMFASGGSCKSGNTFIINGILTNSTKSS